ncbi:MAG: NADH-quinone oxidoreductase subunit L [Chloroflexi bacterium]|nr:NADH-quinone oxidoreductase subunit L [Chloroflexota bacterium]
MFDLVVLVILLPLLGVIVNAFFGRRLGERWVSYIGPGAVGLSFLVALILVLSLAGLPVDQRHHETILWTWIPIGNFQVDLGFLLDPLSAVMILIITGVGFLIHIYSVGYMHGDPRFARYFTYLNLFVASMLTLVLGNNFLVLFMGWELVGLCSYLLIGFWFERVSASDAAVKAFVVNRIGDFGFILGVMLIWTTFGTLHFTEVFEAAEKSLQSGAPVAIAITLLLLIGATGKSAQIPLYVWLPDAMAGPTPVSALIHAATMVTAGVYMMARSHVLFELAPFTGQVVAWIGAATALLAASIGVAQYDIKKVLAYSTVSQLGFMVAAAGMGAFGAAMFHLTTHAFFKGLLFLGAGSVIHGVHDEQDMRKMGGLRSSMPTTFWTFVVAALALAGIPPLSGFFSKDEILATASSQNIGIYLLLTIAAFLTAFYIGRQVLMVFFGQARSDVHAHESPRVMTIPLIVLAVFAAIAGFFNLPGVGSFSGWLGEQAGELNLAVAAISTLLALAGLGLAWLLYGRSPVQQDQRDPLAVRLGPVFTLLERKWYVDEIVDLTIARPFKALCSFLAGEMDLGIVDGFVNGVAWLVSLFSRWLRTIQTGFVRSYALAMLLGAVLLIVYVATR